MNWYHLGIKINSNEENELTDIIKLISESTSNQQYTVSHYKFCQHKTYNPVYLFQSICISFASSLICILCKKESLYKFTEPGLK